MKLNFFNFRPFDKAILLTNDFGKYIFVSSDEFKKIIKKEIDISSPIADELISKRFIYTDTKLEYSSNLMYDMRRIKSYVNIATSLHIFVVTTACNMNCIYCQANNGNGTKPLFMSKEMAEKAVDIALQSPEI